MNKYNNGRKRKHKHGQKYHNIETEDCDDGILGKVVAIEGGIFTSRSSRLNHTGYQEKRRDLSFKPFFFVVYITVLLLVIIVLVVSIIFATITQKKVFMIIMIIVTVNVLPPLLILVYININIIVRRIVWYVLDRKLNKKDEQEKKHALKVKIKFKNNSRWIIRGIWVSILPFYFCLSPGVLMLGFTIYYAVDGLLLLPLAIPLIVITSFMILYAIGVTIGFFTLSHKPAVRKSSIVSPMPIEGELATTKQEKVVITGVSIFLVVMMTIVGIIFLGNWIGSILVFVFTESIVWIWIMIIITGVGLIILTIVSIIVCLRFVLTKTTVGKK